MELKGKKKLFLISMAIPILAVVHVAGITTISFLQTQIAVAQQTTGDITRSSDGKPFGGEKMGTVSIDSTGRRTNVTADLTASPNEGKVFEGWLVDAGGSGYKLSLGQFRNGTLNFSEYLVNPYTYKNFEITEEPSEDPDPNAAASIAGFELKTPFGR
jgi:Anti-sigma-K factor rskA, C-terminal/Divergent InlB B-repeat domain